MTLGSIVYQSGAPDMPGTIAQITDTGITILWITNEITVVDPARLHDYASHLLDLYRKQDQILCAIDACEGHIKALTKMREAHHIPEPDERKTVHLKE